MKKISFMIVFLLSPHLMAGQGDMHDAIVKGDFIQFKNLIKNGASIMWLDDDSDQTLFQLASLHKQNEIITYLVNARDEYNNNLLHLADVHHSKVEDIVALIKAGVDINAINDHGNTPLHIDASNATGTTEILSTFLEHGAKIHIPNIHGQIAVELVPRIRKDKLSIYRNAKDENNNNLLHLSILNYNPVQQIMFQEKIKFLKSFGVDVNALNNKGQSPYDLALLSKNQNILSLFINDSDENGQTRLYLEVLKDNVEGALFLIKNGANKHKEDKSSNTSPYSLALTRGNPKMIVVFNRVEPSQIKCMKVFD